MNWTKQIDRCEFLLDYVHITIVSDNPRDLVKQLSQYAQFKKNKLEKYAKHPYMAGMFKSRSYFSFGKIVKMYLIHDKIAPRSGINALLVLHDVPILELAQIEKILEAIPAVTDFRFCRIEFKWDIYPKKTLSAVDLQKHLVRHLHLKSAQDAFRKKNGSRITYYINRQPSDLQSKVYIRPKVLTPAEQEFVRFELTAKTRWLEDIGLMRPSDFKDLKYGKIVRQVRWLDLKLSKVRRIQLSLLTGGEWKEQIREKLEKRGLAKVIIDHRKDMVCPPGCKRKGHAVDCQLNRAYKRKRVGDKLVAAIEKCEFAKENDKFEIKACEPSRYRKTTKTILRKAYIEWIYKFPKFPITISKLSMKRTRKKSVVKTNIKLKLPVLFS